MITHTQLWPTKPPTVHALKGCSCNTYTTSQKKIKNYESTICCRLILREFSFTIYHKLQYYTLLAAGQ